MDFKKINKIAGLTILFISTLVYYLTVEPTASFWDSGEFIATAYTLGIPHPPGAPLFLLVAKLFSFLSLGNPEKIAFWTNMVSVLFSSLTIFLLYHSLVLIGRKFYEEASIQSFGVKLAIISSAGMASLIYAFSDSFWFSATETEVYAMSSFFTALVVWLMLKWDIMKDSIQSDKILILLAYLMGLSFGVHLLNLLAIPTLGIIYYYKNTKVRSFKNFLVAMFISCSILIVLLYGLVGTANLAKALEILFVNSFGLPFGSGIIFFSVLLIVFLAGGIIYSIKKNNRSLNLILVSVVFVFIGYSSYLTIIIRSNYNPPINHSNPSNIMSLISYLNMESYPTRPLLYGPYFTAELVNQQNGKPVYVKENNRYKLAYHKIENTYDPLKSTLFPRVYSTNLPEHAAAYREILNLKDSEELGFIHNISYFVSHQIGHMYLRYLLWNFAGRASDVNNAGWLSPLDIFDKVPELIENNKARNNYLMLPLLLALTGLYLSYKQNKQVFNIIFSLFVMTGLALVVYINAPPFEPRERDYIFTGSFYAFSLWIGIGILGIYKYFINRGYKKATYLWSIGCLTVPMLMLSQNWDDHDRSGRYYSVDVAKNILSSCEENAILFTGGDNDTYPLWYAQEVEGFRTDVRIIVLPFFNTDWFIDQNKRPLRSSEAVPLSLGYEQYRQGGLNEYLPLYKNPNIKEPVDIGQFLALIKKDHPAIQLNTSLGNLNYLPSNKLSLNIDTEDILTKGIIPPGKEEFISNKITYEVKGKHLEKKDLMILDLIDTNKWERPIYFNATSLSSINIDLNNFVVQEGDTFKLLPIKSPSEEVMVNTAAMYENMMHKYQYRGMDNPDAYYHGYYSMYTASSRANFNILAQNLMKEGEIKKAKKVIDKSFEAFPDKSVPYDYSTIDTVNLLLQLDEKAKADEVAEIIADRADEFLNYFAQNPDDIYRREVSVYLVSLQNFGRYYHEAGHDREAIYYQNLFNKHYQKLAYL